MSASRCRSCDAPIRWARTEAGGVPIPLDAEPNPEGNAVELEDGRIRIIAGPLEVEPRTVLWMPHHATCPHGREWKGRRK